MAELARRELTQIRRASDFDNPFAEYAPISRYTGDPSPLPATPDWLATISAGKRAQTAPGAKPGLPQMSRDGRIELHDPDGRAPGLAAALEATDHKKLLIAFVSNDPRDVIHERIVGYTATTLKYHGDAEAITQLTPKRVVHRKGTPGYDAALAECTVSRRVFFALARWDDDGTPRVYFPDGLGLYCIRTTSERSTGNIAATLALIGRQTGGIIVGLPFELSLSNRQVADRDGSLRTVALWSMVFSPPRTMQLTSGTFRMLAEKSIEQGRALMLPPAPRPESIEDAAYEGTFTIDETPVVSNPSAADIAVMQRGAPVDAEAARKRWFAIVRGRKTRFATQDGRADWVSAWTDGNYDSLAAWIQQATQQEADVMLDTLERCVQEQDRLPKAWEGLPELDEPEIDRETGEIIEPDRSDSAPSYEDEEAERDDPWASDQAEPSLGAGHASEPTPGKGDPLTVDREAREALMAELARLLDEAAAVGYPPEEIAVAELGNPELAAAVTGLAHNLKRYKANLGQAS